MVQKVLVTGGSGLVGRHLQELVNNADWRFLSSKDCDLQDEKATFELFEEYQPDVVVHLASRVAGLYGNMDNNFAFLIDNMKIHTNVIASCKKYNVKTLINILSTCIFPDELQSYPIKSNQIHLGPPHYSNSGYAYSKRFLHIASELLPETTVVNIIPTNLYGKYDNFDLKNSHVIPALIHKLKLAKNNNDDFVINGDGSALRQFLYAKDLAAVIKYFAEDSDVHNKTLIVSPDYEISIKELVNILVKIFDFKGNIIYDSSFNNGQHKKTASSTELMQYVPNFIFTELHEGLEETVNYFIHNYDSCRI